MNGSVLVESVAAGRKSSEQLLRSLEIKQDTAVGNISNEIHL